MTLTCLSLSVFQVFCFKDGDYNNVYLMELQMLLNVHKVFCNSAQHTLSIKFKYCYDCDHHRCRSPSSLLCPFLHCMCLLRCPDSAPVLRSSSSEFNLSDTGSLECYFLARAGYSDHWKSEQAGVGLALCRDVVFWWEEIWLVRTQLWLAQVSCCTDEASSLPGSPVMDPSQGCHLLSQE